MGTGLTWKVRLLSWSDRKGGNEWFLGRKGGHWNGWSQRFPSIWENGAQQQALPQGDLISHLEWPEPSTCERLPRPACLALPGLPTTLHSISLPAHVAGEVGAGSEPDSTPQLGTARQPCFHCVAVFPPDAGCCRPPPPPSLIHVSYIPGRHTAYWWVMRSLVCCSSWGHKQSDATEQITHTPHCFV